MFDDFLKGFIPPNDSLTCLINTRIYLDQISKFSDSEVVEMVVDMISLEGLDDQVNSIVALFFKKGVMSKEDRFILEAVVLLRTSKLSIGEDGSLVDEFKLENK